MKKWIIFIIVILVGGGSFYFFQLKRELILTSPHERRSFFKGGEIEAISRWKIAPQNTAKSNTRTCIWTIEFINRSLDSIYSLWECEFILKDRNNITIATDRFLFPSYGYGGYLLNPGERWEAHGTIFLSEIEARIADHSTLTLSCTGRLADKEIREKRKKNYTP